MTDSNPYATPQATINTEADYTTYQPQFLSTQGRIGRLRYLAYNTGINIILMLVIGAVLAIWKAGEAMMMIGGILAVVLYIALIVFSVIYGKRRLNDLNQSGWLFLLFLVPLVNLAMAIFLIFFRGNESANRFGQPPAENPLSVKILGLVMPIIFIAGILAAVAIPAYMQFTERAKQAEYSGDY